MKRLAWVLGSGVLLLAGLVLWWFWGRPAQPTSVHVVTVKPSTLTEAVYASGTIVAKLRQEVRAASPGKVAKVLVKTGDAVLAGQVLVQMDSTIADAQVAQAQASLDAAKAGQTLAQKNLAQAEDRLATLKANPPSQNVAIAQAQGAGIPSADTTLQLEGSVEQLQGSVQQAGSAVKQAEAALNMALAQRDQLTYKAGFVGTVLEVNAQEGNPASLQSPLLVVADLKSLYVQAALNEVDAGKVKSGQKVFVSSKSLSLDVGGQVQTLAPEAVARPSLQGNAAPTVDVTLSLDQVSETLKPGYSVNVKVQVASKSGVLAVPQEVLFQEGERNFVYTEAGGKLRKAEVKTGIADDVNQEITSGLKTGDQVVLSPTREFYDGMPVTVVGGGGG